MGFDAVVVGALASVVVAVIVFAVIGHYIIKNMDNNSEE